MNTLWVSWEWQLEVRQIEHVGQDSFAELAATELRPCNNDDKKFDGLHKITDAPSGTAWIVLFALPVAMPLMVSLPKTPSI
jgi:hypothetical protein